MYKTVYAFAYIKPYVSFTREKSALEILCRVRLGNMSYDWSYLYESLLSLVFVVDVIKMVFFFILSKHGSRNKNHKKKNNNITLKNDIRDTEKTFVDHSRDLYAITKTL